MASFYKLEYVWFCLFWFGWVWLDLVRIGLVLLE